MHAVRKKRLMTILVALIGFGVAVMLLLYALSQNINHFFTPTELHEKQVSANIRARVGGLVKENSVSRQADSLEVVFIVTDKLSDVSVSYTGILPDLFREGQGVVVTGRYHGDGHFVATEVLAKHDENYMPPEAYEALKKAAENPSYP